ncbi:MAG TPA: hypothetical protein VLJ14_02515 [Ktedonobacterales bacterium]|jgi:hypothetical protein|nr:hypothetical protein [Ktedonobacterales bacterium]
MAKARYRDRHAFALGVIGGAALLATMAGEYLMHNIAQVELWNACYVDRCPEFEKPLPATAVTLPGGSTLDITIYQVIVLALGALIFIGAIACAVQATRTSRGVLAVAAVLLALTLMFFHAQTPRNLKIPIGGCIVGGSCFTNPEIVPFTSTHSVNGVPVPPPMVNPVWFMVPAAALGLLTASIALLPAARRQATP